MVDLPTPLGPTHATRDASFLHLNGHVLHRRHRVDGVGVGAVVHLHQGLTL